MKAAALLGALLALQGCAFYPGSRTYAEVQCGRIAAPLGDSEILRQLQYRHCMDILYPEYLTIVDSR